jgi:fibronectin type 3 domain-containing protein
MRTRGIYVVLALSALVSIVVLTLRHPASTPHSVTLSWHSPPSHSGVTIVGYNVYRKTVDASSYIRIAERVAGSPYEDRLVSTGRTYLYVVTSLDQDGRESRFSPAVRAEIP